MVTNEVIDDVIRALKRFARRGQWEPAVMAHYAGDPFLTLIGCLLSLRTQDVTTYGACQRLFKLAKTPKALAVLPIPQIERAIYPVGFYRTKARVIRRVAQDLLDRFDGKVPSDLDTLLTITGVGRKTANLVITVAFQQHGICVDTHVHRITNRWGYVKTATPEQTEWALREQLPKRHWRIINDLLVVFGQHWCRPISPRCSGCPLNRRCARVGVTVSR